jgi:hypothetical protein
MGMRDHLNATWFRSGSGLSKTVISQTLIGARCAM